MRRLHPQFGRSYRKRDRGDPINTANVELEGDWHGEALILGVLLNSHDGNPGAPPKRGRIAGPPSFGLGVEGAISNSRIYRL